VLLNSGKARRAGDCERRTKKILQAITALGKLFFQMTLFTVLRANILTGVAAPFPQRNIATGKLVQESLRRLQLTIICLLEYSKK